VVHSRNVRAVIFHPRGKYLFVAAPDPPRLPQVPEPYLTTLSEPYSHLIISQCCREAAAAVRAFSPVRGTRSTSPRRCSSHVAPHLRHCRNHGSDGGGRADGGTNNNASAIGDADGVRPSPRTDKGPNVPADRRPVENLGAFFEAERKPDAATDRATDPQAIIAAIAYTNTTAINATNVSTEEKTVVISYQSANTPANKAAVNISIIIAISSTKNQAYNSTHSSTEKTSDRSTIKTTSKFSNQTAK
jgi:hypothetical protein